jgi:hypothetical protein
MQELAILWITTEYLPACCPQLNPVEHEWSTTKSGHLANWPATDINAIHQRIQAELGPQSDDRVLLSNHFRWVGLERDILLCLSSRQ